MAIQINLKGGPPVRIEEMSEGALKELVTDIRKKRGKPDELVKSPTRPKLPRSTVRYFFASEVVSIEVADHPTDLDLTQTVVGLPSEHGD
jgi:hypothetical protein